MNQLPYEIWEVILSDSVLNEKDVVNFGSTCSEYRNLVNSSNVIWECKFFQRWGKRRCRKIIVDNWMVEYKLRGNIEKETMKLLSEMSPEFYMLNELSDTELNYVNDFVNSSCNASYYIVDYLIRLLNYSEIQASMTIKYYGNKLLKHIKKHNLSKLWHKMEVLDVKLQTLEKGAIFVADWFQINDETVEDTVCKNLNYITDLVRKYIKEEYKEHPLNDISEETFFKWRSENIDGNNFEPMHCQQIIHCVNHVLLNKLQYYFEPELWAPELSLDIDSALYNRKTTPLFLGVIYESVSRRLGVKCEVISFPGHCLLRWYEDYSKKDSPYHYIDLSGKGLFLKAECCSKNTRVASSCPINQPNVPIQSCNMKQIAQKVARDILSADQIKSGTSLVSDPSILELLLLFSPSNVDLYVRLGRYCMKKNMNINGLIKKLTDINPKVLSKEDQLMYQIVLSGLYVYKENWELSFHDVKVKTRTEEIKFAVGMIGRLKIYNLNCVVYGWDPFCESYEESGTCGNGEPSLTQKYEQPFYRVLGDDSSEYYVAQEDLQIIHSPPFIYHPKTGHYFEEFCTTYYKPNEQLQNEYPEDAEALKKLIQRHSEE